MFSGQARTGEGGGGGGGGGGGFPESGRFMYVLGHLPVWYYGMGTNFPFPSPFVVVCL